MNFYYLFFAILCCLMSVVFFRWYNNGKGGPLGSFRKRVKCWLAFILFFAGVVLLNFSIGKFTAWIDLINNIASTFIGFAIALMYRNRII